MKIKIQTAVNQSINNVWEGFNQNLFTQLAPPFPPVNLLRFDGSEKNDEIHIELNLLIFKQLWISLITENEKSENEIYFIDEGIKLPFFLTSWKHKHRIVKAIDTKTQTQSLIIDEIEFGSPLGFLIYPALYLQFLYRRPIYQRIFS